MYSDYEPCRACGSPVELRPARVNGTNEPDGPTDERFCLNEDCVTHGAGATAQP